MKMSCEVRCWLFSGEVRRYNSLADARRAYIDGVEIRKVRFRYHNRSYTGYKRFYPYRYRDIKTWPEILQQRFNDLLTMCGRHPNLGYIQSDDEIFWCHKIKKNFRTYHLRDFDRDAYEASRLVEVFSDENFTHLFCHDD